MSDVHTCHGYVVSSIDPLCRHCKKKRMDARLIAHFMLEGHEEIREHRVWGRSAYARECSIEAVRLFIAAHEAHDRAWRSYVEATH